MRSVSSLAQRRAARPHVASLVLDDRQFRCVKRIAKKRGMPVSAVVSELFGGLLYRAWGIPKPRDAVER